LYDTNWTNDFGNRFVAPQLLRRRLAERKRYCVQAGRPCFHHSITKEIISMFSDTPSAPFSIQEITLKGQDYGKYVGEWFGPNTISCALKFV
jgi:hypothetical protein